MGRIILSILLYCMLACLLQAQTPRLVVPNELSGWYWPIAFSPNGKMVLIGYSKTAKLWDLSGRELATFSTNSKEFKNQLNCVAFSPDGKKVLTGYEDGAVILSNLSGKELKTFYVWPSVGSVAFSPDCKTIITEGYYSGAHLWDLSGNKLDRFQPGDSKVYSVTFSPDGKTFLTGNSDSTATLWDLSGNELHRFQPGNSIVYSVAFSPDGKTFLKGNADSTATLWDLSGKALKSFSGHTSQVTSVAFSPDGKTVLTRSWDGTAKLWNLSGKELHTFSSEHATVFSSDGKTVLTSSSTEAKLCDFSGKELQSIRFGMAIKSIALSPDGKSVLTAGDGGAKLWDLSGREVMSFSGHVSLVEPVSFSSDGKEIQMGSDKTAYCWDLSGRGLKSIKLEPELKSFVFSPDGKKILTISGSNEETARYEKGLGKTVKLWDLSGRELRSFNPGKLVSSIAFSPDGQTVLTGGDEGARLWDLNGKLLQTFGHSGVTFVTFSPDGKFILVGYYNWMNTMWDLSGRELLSIESNAFCHYGAFSPDGKTILLCCRAGVSLYDLSGKSLGDYNDTFYTMTARFSPDGKTIMAFGDELVTVVLDYTGKPLYKFEGDAPIAFSKDGKQVLTASFNTSNLWDVGSGNLLASLLVIDSTDWVVTTPSGLFDASEGAKKRMYYVVDYEEEMIILSLEQLQERYWQPGLLGSIMGLTPYPVRDVGVFDNLPLFPSIEERTGIESGHLKIKLRERNGGLGKLMLRINGIVRNYDLNPLPKRKTVLDIDLKNYNRFIRTDTLNIIELEVYESKNELKSEPYLLHYQASVKKRGDGSTEDKRTANNCLGLRDRHLYLIVVGTSLYPQGVDSLPSANEDAIEMARVLSASGKQLYDEQVHLTLLSTTRGKTPSKANIAAAFKAYEDSANVCDVLVVFFAGHGKNWGADGDKSNFYYLTKDITFGKLNDDGIRKASAISDQELTEWMGKIPAENKLLILDACNSGQAAINMGGIVARDIDPDKIVAFNLMSGNTGSYVISGSSASGASFESAVFGHGLLTYSLLEGINGTALEGSKVDVLPLLLKSYKRVGELAQSLGEEQTPIIAKPRGNASFFVGRNDGSIKIDLPESKPMVIRSFLFDQDAFNDPLDLTKAVNSAFRAKEAKGKLAPWFYSDIPEHPQGFSVRGFYIINKDNTVTVKGRLLKGEDLGGAPFEVSGTKDAKALADLILKAVKPSIRVK